jgi:hypothetical protein
MMDKLDLVAMAIREWANGELTADQTLFNIVVVIGIRDPSPECTEWAKRVMKTGDKYDNNL